MFSPSINRLGIRGIVFNDYSVGVVLITLMPSLIFRERKVVLASYFDSGLPWSSSRSSPDVFFMDAFLRRLFYDFLPLLPPTKVVDEEAYQVGSFHPCVAGDGLGFYSSRLECLVPFEVVDLLNLSSLMWRMVWIRRL